MEIFAKSALKEEDIDVKMGIGCDGIEIQLLDELVDGEIGKYKKADDVFELSKFLKYPIRAIHAPLMGNYGLPDVNIESLVGRDRELLEEVCFIADFFGIKKGYQVLVVVHSEMNLPTLECTGLLDMVISVLDNLLSKYSNIKFVFENVTPLRGVNGNNVSLCNNFGFDNVKLVKLLRTKLGTDRIGTCLDTCHAGITEKYINVILDAVGKSVCKGYALNNFFEENKEVIGLIHLADYQGNGYGKGNHGTEFNSSNKDKLIHVVDLYNVWGYDCPVTLEINETDYLICNGYRNSRETLTDVLNSFSEQIKSA